MKIMDANNNITANHKTGHKNEGAKCETEEFSAKIYCIQRNMQDLVNYREIHLMSCIYHAFRKR